ncbi:MAG: hypothetical protein KatS3mg034_1587 [Vicingaceae bacterium]|nr:MAG: hypothetical protein KatS3mg034_1587 [Vicingaceae bacterium]
MMTIEIISPEEIIYSGEIVAATFPGKEGSFGVLKNHAPLISTLKKGKIEVTDVHGKKSQYDVNGGVVEVNGNKIIVLVQ